MSNIQIVATIASSFVALAAFAFAIWKFKFETKDKSPEWFVLTDRHFHRDPTTLNNFFEIVFRNEKSPVFVETTVKLSANPFFVKFDPPVEHQLVESDKKNYRLKFRVPPKATVKLVLVTDDIHIRDPDVISDTAAYKRTQRTEKTVDEIKANEGKKFRNGVFVGLFWGAMILLVILQFMKQLGTQL